MNRATLPFPFRSPALSPDGTRRDARKAEFETNKLKRRLRRQVGQAIADYGMIEEGDRVMVCPSGGTATACRDLRGCTVKSPVAFDIIAVNLTRSSPISGRCAAVT
jgi:tRNA 2-thiocytidine biosynthesis protein TtcA